jgi:hypothetical protein
LEADEDKDYQDPASAPPLHYEAADEGADRGRLDRVLSGQLLHLAYSRLER